MLGVRNVCGWERERVGGGGSVLSYQIFAQKEIQDPTHGNIYPIIQNILFKLINGHTYLAYLAPIPTY
jgi:hypothetical protein